MTKTNNGNKPPQLFYFIILGFIILVGLNFAGDYNLREQEKVDPQVQANLDTIIFLTEIDKSIQEAIVKQSIRSAKNADDITDLYSYDTTITTQIGDIKQDIRNKFPMASNVLDTPKSSTSTTPFLTLKMDKTEFVLGNTVIFYGTATPNDPVILTLKLPDRGLESIGIAKSEIINGAYTGNFTLRLDDPVGIGKVYARQGQSDQTKTLTFTVE